MSLVLLVLIIVFTSICFFSYQSNKAETYNVMERVLNSEFGMPPPSLEIKDMNPSKLEPMLPVFSVLVSKSGEISFIRKEIVTVSGEIIKKITESTLTSGKHDGVLFDMQLRFLTKETSESTEIAFADMSRELTSLKKLILSLVFVGLGGLIAFFFISLFISKWILHPVEKAWQQQRQFVADASHELKTPLTVILANIGILLSHPKDTIKSHAKWLENTNAEAIRMKTLIEDLLFLAKSDAARTEMLKKSNINFSDVLWSCVLSFEPLAYEKGHLIESNIDSEILLFGDLGQLKQLIINLLNK
jgi:signal transduction histidine kinase